MVEYTIVVDLEILSHKNLCLSQVRVVSRMNVSCRSAAQKYSTLDNPIESSRETARYELRVCKRREQNAINLAAISPLRANLDRE